MKPPPPSAKASRPARTRSSTSPGTTTNCAPRSAGSWTGREGTARIGPSARRPSTRAPSTWAGKGDSGLRPDRPPGGALVSSRSVVYEGVEMRIRSLRERYPRRWDVPLVLSAATILLPLGLFLPTVTLSKLGGASRSDFSVVTGIADLARGGNLLLAL